MTSGFELLREQSIPEINAQGRLYRHRQTGAELLALSNDDPNKTFGVTLRTLPEDDTGLPHILEHSVLGGSEKYPVKEPFLQLVKGSLATFINALTFEDFTAYPVASQNLQDFYNLVDVYLDAVFHPLLSRHTFEQEGWHFELEQEDGPLAYRGIVYNEMKGMHATPDYTLGMATMRALFPDVGYRHDAGGDPRQMPQLSYEQFREFHARHYHPANARLYLYGDVPLEETLARLDDFLDDFGEGEAAAPIPLQPAFEAPRQVRAPYQAGEDDGQAGHYVQVSWLLPETTDPVQALALAVLKEALLGSPGSPLRRALLDAGLGEDVLTGDSWSHTRQPLFAAGLRGVDPEKTDEVEPLILETLGELADDGLAPETVAAAVNTVAFRLRENNPGGFMNGQRGLILMFRSLNRWLYDGDPFEALAFAEPLAELQQRLDAERGYLEGMIREHLLDNDHRVTVTLEPAPELGEALAKEERARLAEKETTLAAEERAAIRENTRALQARQNRPDSPEELATLPMLAREDVEREARRIPREEMEVAGTRVFLHPLPTNGILYLDLGFNLRALPDELLPYAELFGRTLLEMGTHGEDVVTINQRIGRATGGIEPELLASAALAENEPGPVWLFLRGKAMVEQTEELLAIVADLLDDVNLDDAGRFRQLVLAEKARREAALLPSAHRVLIGRLRAHFDDASWAEERLQGLESLFFLRSLAGEIEDDWPAVRARLVAVRAALLNRKAMLANVTVDEAAWPDVREMLAGFLEKMPADAFSPISWRRPELPRREGFAVPSQVNYVAKAAPLYNLGYERHGSARAVTRYLTTTWLWEKIRAEGGAYGAPASFEPMSGIFAFASYRDPNLQATLDVYDASGEFLRRLEMDEAELDRAIIGAAGDLDPARLPDAHSFASLARALTGFDDARRQREREELLEARVADFQAFAAPLEALRDAGHLAVIGSEEQLRALDEAHGGEWLTIRRAL